MRFNLALSFIAFLHGVSENVFFLLDSGASGVVVVSYGHIESCSVVVLLDFLFFLGNLLALDLHQFQALVDKFILEVLGFDGPVDSDEGLLLVLHFFELANHMRVDSHHTIVRHQFEQPRVTVLERLFL